MKDNQPKPSPTLILMPKSKLGIKKEKMAAKKPKEHKTPIMKVGKPKKSSKNSDARTNKDNSETPVKRKRGRPRNVEKVQNKNAIKDQKAALKRNDSKGGRKRKLNSDLKLDKDGSLQPPKKPKIVENNCNVNGNFKLPFAPHRQFIQRGESPTVIEHSVPNSVNSNGTVHCKKLLALGLKKSPSSILKSPTFHPSPKKDLLNGNSCPIPIKVQSTKNNKIPKKEPDSNSASKNDIGFNVERINNTAFSSKSMANELAKPLFKDTLKPHKEFLKDIIKVQSKEPTKSQPKEVVKLPLKDPVKTLPKEPIKPQLKDVKPQSKETSNPSVKSAIKESTKSTKEKTSKEPFKPFPIKSHPQRMASLDAMARMHVICTTDRKPPEPKASPKVSVASACSQRSFSQKSITHERIQVDVKKETNDYKGNIVHKQEINFVKEKQQVFVSHSMEQSSIVEHEQSKTISKVQIEKEKKTKTKAADKALLNKECKSKSKQNAINHSKLLAICPKPEKGKSKNCKIKDNDKKCAKELVKSVSKVAKSKEKDESKGSKKLKKLDQAKNTEVKVKETIRMQKTCTYQSVTTVNSHGASTSSVPVSHVGMTTNFSKTKTVVTDEECKNKINYSAGSVVNNTYHLTSESPCSVGSRSDCCKFHAHPQFIPLAHVQTCSIAHGLSRTSDSPSSHCDGSCTAHKFGHQQPVILTSSPECGCCCPSSLVQNVHNPCLLRKSFLTYPHHLSTHRAHLSSAFAAEAICSDCHPSNSALDPQRHRSSHFTVPSPSHSRVSCCASCESTQHHQYVSPKSPSSTVPCEQSPLDLSLTSSSSTSVETDISLPQGHCPSPLCCRDVLLLRTSPHGFQHNFPLTKSCCRCSKPVVCDSKAVDVQPCSNRSIIKIDQHQATNHTSLLGQRSVPPAASTSVVESNSVPRIVTDDSLVTAKQEKSISPKQSSKLQVFPKKRIFAHGWSWKGKPREKMIALTNDSVQISRLCYPCIQHKEGDTISEKDCVLLRSGPKDTDLPYVAKVAAFWENPDDGEMMMSLLWYYRPEHTDQGRKPNQMEDEVFASRHKDANSVACIEDKCYVLTYNEYCRYKANLCMDDDLVSKASLLVPGLPDGYPRKHRLPPETVSQDIVFFCRHVYDFRQKRILKNPT